MTQGYPADVIVPGATTTGTVPVAGGGYVQPPQYIDQSGGGMQGYNNYPQEKSGYGSSYPHVHQHYGPHYGPGYAGDPYYRKKKNTFANTVAALFIACWVCTWPCHGPCCCGF